MLYCTKCLCYSSIFYDDVNDEQYDYCYSCKSDMNLVEGVLPKKPITVASIIPINKNVSPDIVIPDINVKSEEKENIKELLENERINKYICLCETKGKEYAEKMFYK